MLRRSDRTLKQCFPSVRSVGSSASGRARRRQGKVTKIWLHPVGVHRTRPVAIPKELDLSGIDRTLGGSVRSLPPERPVSRKHAAYGLFFGFLLYLVGAVAEPTNL